MKTKLLFVFIFSVCMLQTTVSSAQIIAAGGNHSLALCSDNTARSWGNNADGQLGDGTTTWFGSPVQVLLTGITALTAGQDHSLFLKNDSTVWACGLNFSNSAPIQVSTLTNIIAVSSRYWHSLFLKSDGTVWASGDNTQGQLGNGTTTYSATPVQVNAVTGIVAIAAGAWHSVFLKSDGTVWACGSNGAGQLGIGSLDNNPHPTPVQMNLLTGIIGVAAGGNHSIFLKNDGTVRACGLNIDGQIGDGTSGNFRTNPVLVNSLSGITSVVSGVYHSIFVRNDGTVWVCGWNQHGELGIGTSDMNPHPIPVQVTTLAGITAAAGGFYYSLFLKNDGTVWNCGITSFGPSLIPTQVPALCQIPTDIAEQQQERNFQIYPNPATIEIGIENAELRIESVEIYDVLGQQRLTLNPSPKGEGFRVDVSSLSAGIYFVKVRTEKEEHVAKFVKH